MCVPDVTKGYVNLSQIRANHKVVVDGIILQLVPLSKAACQLRFVTAKLALIFV